MKKIYLTSSIIFASLLLLGIMFVGLVSGGVPNSIGLSKNYLSLGFFVPHWGQIYEYRELPSLRYSCTCGEYLEDTCSKCPLE